MQARCVAFRRRRSGALREGRWQRKGSICPPWPDLLMTAQNHGVSTAFERERSENLPTSAAKAASGGRKKGLEPFCRPPVHRQDRAILAEDSPMIGIEIVAKLAELQKQYDDAHMA